MPHDPSTTLIYHITDVDNLPSILASGGLRSDAALAEANPAVIGYTHIKQRRMNEIRIGCCSGRFVGAFVPFYFCPRSPMLYTINKGNTGRANGYQRNIVHLVSTVTAGISQNREWAISDGNAGAHHTLFFANLDALNRLNWQAIRERMWYGQTHHKSAEFLVADFFAWTSIQTIGCYNGETTQRVQQLLANAAHKPTIQTRPNWYY